MAGMRTVREILDEIDARGEVAAECEVEPIAVYRWGQNGSIPSKHLAGVLTVARRNGVVLTAEELIAAHSVGRRSSQDAA